MRKKKYSTLKAWLIQSLLTKKKVFFYNFFSTKLKPNDSCRKSITIKSPTKRRNVRFLPRQWGRRRPLPKSPMGQNLLVIRKFSPISHPRARAIEFLQWTLENVLEPYPYRMFTEGIRIQLKLAEGKTTSAGRYRNHTEIENF